MVVLHLKDEEHVGSSNCSCEVCMAELAALAKGVNAHGEIVAKPKDSLTYRPFEALLKSNGARKNGRSR